MALDLVIVAIAYWNTFYMDKSAILTCPELGRFREQFMQWNQNVAVTSSFRQSCGTQCLHLEISSTPSSLPGKQRARFPTKVHIA